MLEVFWRAEAWIAMQPLSPMTWQDWYYWAVVVVAVSVFVWLGAS